jgi:hypothetical protein
MIKALVCRRAPIGKFSGSGDYQEGLDVRDRSVKPCLVGWERDAHSESGAHPRSVKPLQRYAKETIRAAPPMPTVGGVKIT